MLTNNKHSVLTIIILLMIPILICCDKDKSTNHGNDNCISVIEGEWEFQWIYDGLTILQFSRGIINQSNCYLTYDTDNIFVGLLEGAYWQGINPEEGFEFEGSFIGNSADSFEGTWTISSSSSSGRMVGYHVED